MATGNTKYGDGALESNTVNQSPDGANNNSAFGIAALKNSIKYWNTAVGAYSGYATTTGISNTSVGTNSLLQNTTGGYNTALGTAAMCFNTTGQNNTAVGSNTLQTNTTGIQNTAIGFNSMYKNIDGEKNIAIGFQSLYSNTIGDNNSALGIGSLFNNTDGQNNTAIGFNSLYNNTTGGKNTALGLDAGKLHSGNNNTFLGANTDSGSDSYINSTAIGYGSQIDSSNQIKMGVSDTKVSIPSAILTNTDPASYSATNSIVPKSYVDSFSSGITITASCVCATTANITLSGTQTIDGYSAVSLDRVLVKDQTSSINNGIWIVDSGPWTRATDYPVTGTDVLGYLTFVINGTENGRSAFAQIADPGTVGTTVLEYSIFYSSPFQLGDGLSLSGNILNVDAALTGFLTFVGINGGGNTAYSLDSGSKDILVNGVTVGKGVGTGTNNTAVGQYALQANTTGDSNTALGVLALQTNTTGDNNTALGYNALLYNIDGDNNTAVGMQSLVTNTSGHNNTALGVNSLLFNQTGNFNTAIGTTALQNNTTGYENTAIGYQALQTNTTGLYNTAVGKNALYSNTGDNNTAIGTTALQSNISGNENTAVGLQALQTNTSGLQNTAVGNGALANNTLSRNTALGYIAGYNLTAGSNVTCLGYNSQPLTVNATNQITLGDGAITSLRCNAILSGLSDARDKKDIIELEAGLNFVEKLKPVSFTWNMRDGGKVDIPDTGFIAQDLKQVQIDTGINIPYLVYDENPEKLEASYGKLLPVLVKAIQDLKKEVDELRAQIKQ